MSHGVLEPEPGLRCTVAENPSPMTLDGTRNYLVGGERALLVDPGPAGPEQEPRVRELAGDRRVASVLVTHAHRDHAGGARELADDLGARLMGSAETLRRLDVDGVALEGGDRVPIGGRAVSRGAEAGGAGGGATAAGTPPGVGEPRAGEEDRGLEVVETPGHSADHLAFWWSSRRAVFTGDLVLGSGSAMVGHPDGHVGDYLASVERLADLGPRRLYPGHGDPVDEPSERLRAYRDHRLEREARIRRAVQEGARSVEEIRARAYDELADALEWAADASVRAHLIHLEEKGAQLPPIAGREPGVPGH